jgi:hypothetical protein
MLPLGEIPNPIDPVEMTVWWKQYATKMGLGKFVDIDKLKPEHGAFVVAWVTPLPALQPAPLLILSASGACC